MSLCVGWRQSYQIKLSLRQNPQVAIKECADIFSNPYTTFAWYNEYVAYEKLQKKKSPYLITLPAASLNLNSGYFIFEFCDMTLEGLTAGLHTFDHLQERDMKFIIESLCNGLAFLHGNGIIHRDIKPNNVLIRIQNSTITAVKYCDLGSNIDLIEGHYNLRAEFQKLSNIITPGYCPPECYPEESLNNILQSRVSNPSHYGEFRRAYGFFKSKKREIAYRKSLTAANREDISTAFKKVDMYSLGMTLLWLMRYKLDMIGSSFLRQSEENIELIIRALTPALDLADTRRSTPTNVRTSALSFINSNSNKREQERAKQKQERAKQEQERAKQKQERAKQEQERAKNEGCFLQ